MDEQKYRTESMINDEATDLKFACIKHICFKSIVGYFRFDNNNIRFFMKSTKMCCKWV